MSVKSAIRDVSELTPNAQKACNLFLERCKSCGLEVLITETYRSQERQNYLYAQGRTTAGKKVTWTKSSRHTSRRAWDICKNIKGEEYSDISFFEACGFIAKELGITWGGVWSTPDMPHFEISPNWSFEEGKMTDTEKYEFEEVKKELQKVKDKVWILENPTVINEKEGVPEWGKEAVNYFTENGILNGNGNGLNISNTKLWVLVILYRTLRLLSEKI